MTNFEYIHLLPLETLAIILIRETKVTEHIRGLECDVKKYISPDGQKWIDFRDAYKATIQWLNTEFDTDRTLKDIRETYF